MHSAHATLLTDIGEEGDVRDFSATAAPAATNLADLEKIRIVRENRHPSN